MYPAEIVIPMKEELTENGFDEMLTATDVEEKFNKLQLFYKEVMVKAGWNKYSVINLQYKNQVVAKRKGADDVKADSLRTLQLMQLIAVNAEKQAGDSLQTMQQDNEKNGADSIMIQQSIQREDNSVPENINLSNTIEKNKPTVQPVLNSANPTAAKNVVKQNAMPLKNPGSTHQVNPINKQKRRMPKHKRNN